MIEWSTARPDWAERIVAGKSLLPDGLPINRTRADKALRIFRRLRIYDVPGQPTMGEACPPWQLDLVEVIFGTYDPDLRRQLIREILVSVAKKNGKSSFAAGIMLTALVLHTRHGEEFLILAPTKDVADNSFTAAYHMVKLDGELLKRFKPSETTRDIINRLDGSILAVKSADAEVIGGQKATSVLVDELWLFGKKSNAKNILSEATGSQAARPEGFALYLTTQSDDPPAGVFRDMLLYYRSIRDGARVDRTKLALIYEYPKAMQEAQAWHDRSTWYIPNPSLGHSVDPEWIATKLVEEEAKGLDSARLFYAKHFNAENGLGYRSDRWAGAEFWERRGDPALTYEALLDRCEVVVIGIDGGGLDDLFGLAVLGRDRDTKQWLLWSHAWCHKSVLDRRKSIASQLEGFAAAGELTIVDDALADISAIVTVVEQVKDRGLLAEVAVDPAGLGEFVDEMAKIEVTVENGLLVGVSQGYRMMNAIKTGERRLANGTLLHGGSGLMAWCVGNVKIEPTATAIRATKQNAGDAKIDPWAAAMNAVDRMSLNPEAHGPSVYEERGVLEFAF